MSNSAFDRTLETATIKGTDTASGVLLVAPEVFRDDEDSDVSATEPVFGALGVSSRPLDADSDGAAEAICARSSDGLPVIALRDLRIEKAAGTLAKGSIRLAGYHGARVSIELDGDSASLVFVRGSDLRVPASNIVQGDPALAKDVALAQPAIDLLSIAGQIVGLLATAVNSLAPGTVTPTQIAQLATALAPYLVGGSPSAPTARAPGILGAPGT